MHPMNLNVKKIKQEMERLGIETPAELARKMGMSRQLMFKYFKDKPIKPAERFGRFFNITRGLEQLA